MLPQFTLRNLLVGVSLLAVYCALLAQWPEFTLIISIPIAPPVLAIVAKLRGAKISVGEIVAISTICLVLFLLLLPAIQTPHSRGRHPCISNQHQIAIALQSYHAARGCYPPPYVADANGRPLVSWRVLILPYIEQGALYDEWKKHRDEPWDGPHNKKISQTVIELFRCPSDGGAATDTSYVAIVGPGTVWPPTGKVSAQDVTDGLSNTLLIVEVANSGINWMEPRDLDLATRAAGINAPAGMSVSSKHPGLACVTFADGRTTTIPEGLSDADLQALFTIDANDNKIVPAALRGK